MDNLLPCKAVSMLFNFFNLFRCRPECVQTFPRVTLAKRVAGKMVTGATACCHSASCFASTLDQLYDSKWSRKSQASHWNIHTVLHLPAILFKRRKCRMTGAVRLIPHDRIVCSQDMRQKGRASGCSISLSMFFEANSSHLSTGKDVGHVELYTWHTKGSKP